MKKESQSCEACGTSITPNLSKKLSRLADGANRLCTSCTRVCFFLYSAMFLSDTPVSSTGLLKFR